MSSAECADAAAGAKISARASVTSSDSSRSKSVAVPSNTTTKNAMAEISSIVDKFPNPLLSLLLASNSLDRSEVFAFGTAHV